MGEYGRLNWKSVGFRTAAGERWKMTEMQMYLMCSSGSFGYYLVAARLRSGNSKKGLVKSGCDKLKRRWKRICGKW